MKGKNGGSWLEVDLLVIGGELKDEVNKGGGKNLGRFEKGEALQV